MRDRGETWRNVVGFEGDYIVSDQGRVMSLPRRANHVSGSRIAEGRVLKPNLIWNGYQQVTLCVGGKRYQKLVHRLVAEAFIPNPSNLSQVNHKNFDRSCNCVDNLEWCTASENTSYSEAAGRIFHNKKRVVRSDGITFDSIADAALATGVDRSGISVVLDKFREDGRPRTAGGYSFCSS